MTGAFEGSPDRAVDRFHQPFGVGGAPHRMLDDGEFVAAEPRDKVALLDAGADTARHGLQQLVADMMAERIVDALELVDVDIKQRERLAPYRTLQLAFDPLAE